ncbi:MAG: hypothetical protein A2X86_07020 [Bdellovibrionales bacterium GWA2_49_15]|nr:MAG: hypothetical protein A2X86_07020 [Bdellovibrionales bacterium GWA2_49_15]HAZ11973.1 hypothetical protein [Bdellovibrionales bacterium]
MIFKIIFLLLLPSISITAFSQTSDLDLGDALYEKREQLENVYKAQGHFGKHLDANPNDVQGLWRASMVNYYIGHLLENEDKRIEHYKLGVGQGEACVTHSAKKLGQCYFWLATNTALLKKEKGSINLAFGISSIIDLFNKALELDPLYAGAGPYRMLALLYFKAPFFLGGDEGKAYEFIKEAIRLKPNEPLNHYFYVSFLVKNKKLPEAKEAAKSFLDKVNPSSFEFFESINAHKKILTFFETGDLPKND